MFHETKYAISILVRNFGLGTVVFLSPMSKANIMRDEEIRRSAALKEALKGQSIVLVGMMGCGKTAIGRLAAKFLELPFFDADEEIEKAAGMSVADFFSTYGEEEFRAGEQKVIARLLSESQCVLALGGGAYLAEQTRECASEHALSVWMHVDLEILYSRVMRRPGKRPLLAKGDPMETIRQLLEKREPIYALADITIVPSAATKNKTCEILLSGIEQYLEKES